MYGRFVESTMHLEHRHNDGSWSRLERAHHDASAHDPERDWSKGKIVFACTTCDELVRLDLDEEAPRPG